MSALTLRRAFLSLRSFIAESEQLREQWVEAMRNAIGEALSNSEVAERIWAEPSNSLCADCEAPQPEWAAINLCVVVCKRCAGLCSWARIYIYWYCIYVQTLGNLNIFSWTNFLIVLEYTLSSKYVCVPGEHRGLGPSISKVRSLKMDRKIWTEELIQVRAHTRTHTR